MKTKFLVLIALMAFTVTVSSAQEFGVKGGLNLYNVNADNDDETDLKPGIHLGVLAHIHMSDQFALQPELVYSMQGAKGESDGNDIRVNMNYVNIPLMFQYMFDNGFRLQAGPQLGFLASAKAKSDGNSVDIKDGYNTIEFGIPFGVGYISPSGFGVDARYHLGLSNIHENNDSKAYNRGLQVGLFYQFRKD